MRLLSKLFALGPFILGFIRAAGPAHDLRVLWLAIASLIGAAIGLIARKRMSSSRDAVTMTSTVIGIASVISSLIAAWILWSLLSVGVAMFAIVFAVCWAASYALGAQVKRANA